MSHCRYDSWQLLAFLFSFSKIRKVRSSLRGFVCLCICLEAYDDDGEDNHGTILCSAWTPFSQSGKSHKYIMIIFEFTLVTLVQPIRDLFFLIFQGFLLCLFLPVKEAEQSD